jgi:hypothetical protein
MKDFKPIYQGCPFHLQLFDYAALQEELEQMLWANNETIKISWHCSNYHFIDWREYCV